MTREGKGFSWQQSVIVFHSAQSGTLIGIHRERTNLRTGLNLKRSEQEDRVMVKCFNLNSDKIKYLNVVIAIMKESAF